MFVEGQDRYLLMKGHNHAIETSGQKPVDQTIPINRHDQKQNSETMSVERSKHQSILCEAIPVIDKTRNK